MWKWKTQTLYAIISNTHCYFSWCPWSAVWVLPFNKRNIILWKQWIQEFDWTMAKLKILTESSLESQKTCPKNFWIKLILEIMVGFIIKIVKLSKYTGTKNTVSTFYGDCILCQKMWKEGSKIFSHCLYFASGFFAGYINLAN